ncbi:putative ClpA ClpB family protein [Lyophyllum shimeji]|uniref:ClpA ClpB family protein n=1 Tax=Lyophyllum shimeji TaxID=47721 RepID=A0A9P3PJS2_LYOSH|nr:putative ClpA ClpB family protein [Lyophyllum shimeji]
MADTGGGHTVGFASPFKPLLSAGRLRCIGGTTPSGYKKYIEADASLERSFTPVVVNELAVPETVTILRTLKKKNSPSLPWTYLTKLNVRMSREMTPARIDRLQFELEGEIRAIERETDSASRERLQLAQKAVAEVSEELGSLKAAYENRRRVQDDITRLQKKIEEFKGKSTEKGNGGKATEAERNHDLPLLRT